MCAVVVRESLFLLNTYKETYTLKKIFFRGEKKKKKMGAEEKIQQKI